MRIPTEKNPENCGWALIDGKYHYYWFDGPHSPSLGELSSDIEGTLLILFLRVYSNAAILKFPLLLCYRIRRYLF